MADKQYPALALPCLSSRLPAEAARWPQPAAERRSTPTPVQTSARRPGTRPLCAQLGTGAPDALSAAACASATAHPGLAIVPIRPCALPAQGPPPLGLGGKQLPFITAAAPAAVRWERPPKLELWAVFLALLGQTELEKCRQGQP